MRELYNYKGELLTISEIARRMGRSYRAISRRIQVCKEKGRPLEDAYNEDLWYRKPGEYDIPCPDGKKRSPKEIGALLGVSADAVRRRIKKAKEEGRPLTDIIRDINWHAGKKKKKRYTLSDQEKEMLERIPAPSELERRIFG